MKEKATKPSASLISGKLKKSVKKLGHHWNLDEKGKKLAATFKFENYLSALMFVVRISVHSEAMRHYCEILLSEREVTVTFKANRQESVSEEDIQLAERINLSLSTRSVS